MIVCWSLKSGSGTTVVASALALLHAPTRPTWLVDLAGDSFASLGLDDPTTPGVCDWLRSPTADGTALRGLAVAATSTLSVVPMGGPIDTDHVEPARWAAFAEALATTDAEVVVDAGSRPPSAALLRRATTSLLVTRACYLSLRRALALEVAPTGVVLLVEPGRSFGTADVERFVGAPVLCTVPYDPAIARACDAGLLSSRLPGSLRNPLRRVA